MLRRRKPSGLSASRARAVPPIPDHEIKSHFAFGAILALCASVLTIVATITALQVLTNLREIASEASDNVEWSLAQVELETRDFTNSLAIAALNPEASLERVRLRFDIFYSRVITLNSAPVYQRLRIAPEFDAALSRVVTFAESAIPTMDATDDTLRQNLQNLIKQSAALRADTRTLSLSGLVFFAEQSDSKRQNITQTLMRLAGLAVLLVAALVGLVAHVLGINRKTRQHGEALAEANTRMNAILSTSMDGVLVVDARGHVLEFNRAAQNIFKYTQDQARGRPILDLIAPDDTRGKHTAAMQRLFAGQKGHSGGKGRVRMEAKRADGTLFPIEIAIELSEEDNQKIAIAFFHDITDRVAAEKELMETRDRALESERAKAEFLTVMSHEIRTPLNGVMGNLSLLNDTSLSETQTRYVRNMEISGRVLMRHVDTVLDIARFEAGRLDINPRCTDLSVLLQELVDSQLSAANRQGSTLSWRWEGPSRAWVRTDRAALEQVLLNLLGNAIKFTQKGTITIEAEALRETIDGTPLVELRVADTGTGISETRLTEIFDDFVTNEPAFGHVPGGTGLGLGIARRIVTAMGGDIGVESTLGEGSVFWVRLPMEDGREPTAPAAAPLIPLVTHLHMLIVEDNDINRELAKDMLQHEGHWVTTANNGAEAVRTASETQFDMILMDIAMPIMDGLQATMAIRKGNGCNKNTPIIAVSANILPQERAHLSASGMSGFLAKPIDRTNLCRLLQDTFGTVTEPDAADSSASNRIGLPKDTYNRLLTRFLEEGETLAAAITAPYRDSKDVAKRCHDLSGAATIFGAHALHDVLSQADTAAKQGNMRLFEEQIIQVPPLWRATRTELSEHRSPNTASPS